MRNTEQRTLLESKSTKLQWVEYGRIQTVCRNNQLRETGSMKKTGIQTRG